MRKNQCNATGYVARFAKERRTKLLEVFCANTNPKHGPVSFAEI